jgi:hypothetical protein
MATQESQKQRVDYREMVPDLPESKMIFIDETAFWVGMSREVARSEKGKRHFV